jgi:hypothetical protein
LIIDGNCDLNNDYIKDNKITKRPEMDVTVDKTSVTANEIDKVVIDKLPDKIVKQRERLGIFLLLVTAVILILVGKKIIEVLKVGAQKSIEGFGVTEKSWNRHFRAWMFLAIAVGSVLLWSYVPLARGLVMGFQDYKYLAIRNLRV